MGVHSVREREHLWECACVCVCVRQSVCVMVCMHCVCKSVCKKSVCTKVCVKSVRESEVNQIKYQKYLKSFFNFCPGLAVEQTQDILVIFLSFLSLYHRATQVSKYFVSFISRLLKKIISKLLTTILRSFLTTQVPYLHEAYFKR
jgi:hypothetical protein